MMAAQAAAPSAARWLRWLSSTPLHPQWLSNRHHVLSRRRLADITRATVVDVGSGDSDSAAELGGDNFLVRVDYPLTNQRYRNPPDVFADGGRMPLADACADVVLLLEVIEHVPDERAVVDEVRRILRPGGTLYLSVPMVYPIHDAPHDYRRFTRHGLERLLALHGLSVRDIRQHGNSWSTAVQMLNLAGLEWAKSAYDRIPGLGYLVGALIYPLCLLGNLVAAPALLAGMRSRSCLGYFVEAVRE